MIPRQPASKIFPADDFFGGATASGAGDTRPGAASDCPQLPQNVSPGVADVPHLAQVCEVTTTAGCIDWPQLPQNVSPGTAGVPQREHTELICMIVLPYAKTASDIRKLTTGCGFP
jgi:hypothetical protein